MKDDRSTNSPKVNTPLTDEQIIAATVGERQSLNSTIYLAPYDPAWPSIFTQLAAQIHEALGDRILLLEHVGSTWSRACRPNRSSTCCWRWQLK